MSPKVVLKADGGVHGGWAGGRYVMGHTHTGIGEFGRGIGERVGLGNVNGPNRRWAQMDQMDQIKSQWLVSAGIAIVVLQFAVFMSLF